MGDQFPPDDPRHGPDVSQGLMQPMPGSPWPLGRPHVDEPWYEKLAKPFPPEQVSYRPQVTCRACRDAPGKTCNKHEASECPNCHQYVSEAHIDLDYVGHADTTRRLLDVDPYWDWRPAMRDVDPTLLAAAIATNNAEIVQAVIENSPPKLDEHGGMWMYVGFHDDNGVWVERLGYGDAVGKSRGPTAIKEVIGDGIRNVTMRAGVALDLWSKSEAAMAARESPEALQQARRTGGKRRTPKRDAEPAADSSPEAQALADLARRMADSGSTAEQLEADVYNQARTQRLLKMSVTSPYDQARCQLWVVIRAAKAAILARDESKGDAEGS